MDDPKALVDELLNLGNLTRWEESFLVSLSDKVDRNIPLSEYEEDKLEEIFKERA